MPGCNPTLIVAAMCIVTPAAQGNPTTSSSAAAAEQLVRLMQQQKLDAVAARDSSEENRYAAALVFPGAQIMAITGIYPVPVLLDERLLVGAASLTRRSNSGRHPERRGIRMRR